MGLNNLPKDTSTCKGGGRIHSLRIGALPESSPKQKGKTIFCVFEPSAGPWFSVEGKNEERGVSGASYLRKLYVTVNGVTVTLMKARRTLVSNIYSVYLCLYKYFSKLRMCVSMFHTPHLIFWFSEHKAIPFSSSPFHFILSARAP